MNSFYIEYNKIKDRPEIIKWLDGCGVLWWRGWSKFSSRTLSSDILISFNSADKKFYTGKFNDSHHCQTAEEFCERIADVMGLEKPRFESSGNSEQLPIKGMAIDVNLLSEDDRKWLEGVEKYAWRIIERANKHKAYIGYRYGLGWAAKEWYSSISYTITANPTEFMEYVSKQTGKEYKVEPELRASLIASSLEDGPSFADIRKALSDATEDCFTPPSYPHKTYRILDSLDGIPLDTRFKLSEWIPPFGAEVLWINEKLEHRFFGELDKITAYGVIVSPGGVRVEDGHWMRIV